MPRLERTKSAGDTKASIWSRRQRLQVILVFLVSWGLNSSALLQRHPFKLGTGIQQPNQGSVGFTSIIVDSQDRKTVSAGEKGSRGGMTPGRNQNASHSPGQQSTVLQNEHSQRLPNGLHEEQLKATALCCAPVTWTFSAPIPLPKLHHLSEHTPHKNAEEIHSGN